MKLCPESICRHESPTCSHRCGDPNNLNIIPGQSTASPSLFIWAFTLNFVDICLHFMVGDVILEKHCHIVIIEHYLLSTL